jgi:hypothetical protein
VSHSTGNGLVSFTVRTEGDQPAFSEGFLCFD